MTSAMKPSSNLMKGSVEFGLTSYWRHLKPTFLCSVEVQRKKGLRLPTARTFCHVYGQFGRRSMFCQDLTHQIWGWPSPLFCHDVSWGASCSWWLHSRYTTWKFDFFRTSCAPPCVWWRWPNWETCTKHSVLRVFIWLLLVTLSMFFQFLSRARRSSGWRSGLSESPCCGCRLIVIVVVIVSIVVISVDGAGGTPHPHPLYLEPLLSPLLTTWMLRW